MRVRLRSVASVVRREYESEITLWSALAIVILALCLVSEDSGGAPARLFLARLLASAHDCAEGGLAVAVAEACVSGPGPLGVEITLAAGGPAELVLFGEGPSRIVVSVPAEGQQHFERLIGEFAIPWKWIGRVGGDRLQIRVGDAVLVSLPANRIEHEWRTGFERLVG